MSRNVERIMGAKKREADYEALERGMRKWAAATSMLKDKYTRERAALNSELARVFLESGASYVGAADLGYLPKSTLQAFVAQYRVNVANGVEDGGSLL
jgi:hypothetical protein